MKLLSIILPHDISTRVDEFGPVLQLTAYFKNGLVTRGAEGSRHRITWWDVLEPNRPATNFYRQITNDLARLVRNVESITAHPDYQQEYGENNDTSDNKLLHN